LFFFFFFLTVSMDYFFEHQPNYIAFRNAAAVKFPD